MKLSWIDSSKKPNWFNKKDSSLIGNPYTMKESFKYLYRLLSFPYRSKRSKIPLPPKELILDNRVVPELTLTFAGDVMPLHDNKIIVTQSVRDFIQKGDFFVCNFEGIISSKPKSYLLAQRHSLTTIDVLSKLFLPEKTILNLSNNHSADFGEKGFQKTKTILQDFGFKIIGALDKPSIIIDESVNITGLTFLSNQSANYIFPCHFIEQGYNDKCHYNILFPHWGYELQLFPETEQKKLAAHLLRKWDAIIGHHPHCIQPIDICQINNQQKILAYSLGNLLFTQKLLRSHKNGLLLQITLGTLNNSSWGINKLNWKITQMVQNNKGGFYLSIIPELSYVSIEKN